MPHDVFVSHSSADLDVVVAIVSGLESRGISCWYASRDIAPGGDYPAEIINAIRTAKVFALVFSANSNVSPDVHREIERAANAKLRLLAIRIEVLDPSPELEYFLSRPQWLDAIGPITPQFIAAIATAIRSEPQSAPGNPGPKKDRRAITMSCTIALTLALGAVVSVPLLLHRVGSPNPEEEGPGSSAPSSGSSGSGFTSGTSTGGEPSRPGPVGMPEGYDYLLPDTRDAYLKAISTARGDSAGDLAIRAYALASIGRVEEAKLAEKHGNNKVSEEGQDEQRDIALLNIANARILEKEKSPNAEDAYATAESALSHPVVLFDIIALARFQESLESKSGWQKALATLEGPFTPEPNAAERTEIRRLRRAAEAHASK